MKQIETKSNITKIESSMEITKRWEDRCSAKLVGKTIKSVRYQFTCEMKDMGWSKKSLVIFFSDGSYMFPSSDDEGNNAGALLTSFKGLEGIPTI
jgi:hypothetical protein